MVWKDTGVKGDRPPDALQRIDDSDPASAAAVARSLGKSFGDAEEQDADKDAGDHKILLE